MAQSPSVTIKRLAWRDPPLASIKLPKGPLRLTLGIGSALARRPGDPADCLWALGDRGPNLKVDLAIGEYGLEALKPLRDIKGLKLLPRPDVGPTLAQLRVGKDRVHLVRTLRLQSATGAPVSGRAPPAGGEGEMEPTYDLTGNQLAPDPGGADTEGLAALADGTFFVSEEYGPSLLKLDGEGKVIERWVPVGSLMTAEAVGYPVRAVLPAIAARRKINRGFEAVTLSHDQQHLHVGFQSALDFGGRMASFARIWTLNVGTGEVVAQHLYPFDQPNSFERDARESKVTVDDLKVCELVALPGNQLLVLERISASAKIYRVDLNAAGTEATEIDIRPAPEEGPTGSNSSFPMLTKTLIFTTDDARKVAPDLEGMVMLSDHELILATDNDFGIEGAETCFYRLTFADALTA